MTSKKDKMSVSVKDESLGYQGEAGIDLIKLLLPKLEFEEFNNEVAYKAGERIRTIFYEQFVKDGLGILITIKLFSGLTVYQAACGANINPTNEDWVRRKYNTVKEFGIPSFLKGKELEKKGRDINSLGPDYAAHGGAYPIRIEGVGGPIGELDSSCASSPLTEKFAIPGAIIVSGMTQDLDHTIISVALQELLGFV